MKKIFIAFGSVVLAALLFIGGVYASDLLKFTGDSQITEAGEGVDEIVEILKQVNDGKITAEEALTDLQKKYDELEGLNPPGLVNQIKELKEEIERLKTELATANTDLAAEKKNLLEANDTIGDLRADIEAKEGYVAHLEAELTRANKAVSEHSQSVQEAVEEARAYKDGE